MHPIYTLLCENGFNQTFKIFGHLFGINAGILLSHFISKMNYYHSKNLLIDGEWFYRRRDDIEENTALTHTQQRNALSILKKTQIIQTCKKDNPAKMYYKINTQILFFILQEAIELKKCIENKTPDKLTEIGRKALQEYSGNETLDQDLMFPYYKTLCFLTSILIYYIETNYIKIKKDFSFQNNKNTFPVNLSDIALPTKNTIKIKPNFSFVESIKLFPKEFQNNSEFKEAWKKWWKIRKTYHNKPVSKHITQEASKIFSKHFSVNDAIKRLNTAADPEKAWFKCYFPNDKKRIPSKGSPGKTIPLKKKKPKSEMTKSEQYWAEDMEQNILIVSEFLNSSVESLNLDLIESELQIGYDWLIPLYEKHDKAYKAAYKSKDEYEINRVEIWSNCIPSMKIIIERYIDDLNKWCKNPSENLFRWNCETFKKFRWNLQKNYYERKWDTGERF